MDQEMTFSLSYEQLTRFAEKRIRECNLDSHGVTYLCESAKAGAVLIFWHELAINGYTSMNAIRWLSRVKKHGRTVTHGRSCHRHPSSGVDACRKRNEHHSRSC